MELLANVTTQKEILWGSNLAGPVILAYACLFSFMWGSYINIFEMDEREHKNTLQTSFFEFKRKVYFIFSYSESKTVFSKKTFILEIVGHFITLVILILLVVSFFISIDAAMILLICSFGAVLSYAITVCVFRDIAFKKAKILEKEAKKKLNNDDDEDEDE